MLNVPALGRSEGIIVELISVIIHIANPNSVPTERFVFPCGVGEFHECYYNISSLILL